MIALQKGHTEIARFIREHIDLQRIQRAQQNLAFMKYFLNRDDLDIDTASKIFSNERSYDPSVSRRIREERRMIEDESIRLQNRQQDTLNDEEWEELYREHPELRGSGKYGKKRNSKKRNSKKRGKKRSKKQGKVIIDFMHYKLSTITQLLHKHVSSIIVIGSTQSKQ